MRYLLLFLLICLPLSAYANMHGSSTIPYILDPTLNNTVVGSNLANVTSGNQNICLGANTCMGITEGNQNVIVANNESVLTTGGYNILLGYGSEVFSSSTSQAIGIAGYKVGSYDTAIGFGALQSTAADGSFNMGVGVSSLALVTTGTQNVGIGNQTGGRLKFGSSSNTLLGYHAGYGSPGLGAASNNNTVIGNGVGSATLGGSNELLIGTSSAIDATSTAESNSIHIGGSGGDWAKVTGTNTQATQATTLNGTLALPNTTSATAAQTGTLCYGTLGAVTYDPSLGCLTSTKDNKKDIITYSGGLDKVLKMRPVSFYYKDTKMTPGEQLGVIAEEILPIESRLIGYGSDGKIRGVKYEGGMDAILISAIQEQEARLDHITEGRDGYRCYGIFWCKDR